MAHSISRRNLLMCLPAGASLATLPMQSFAGAKLSSSPKQLKVYHASNNDQQPLLNVEHAHNHVLGDATFVESDLELDVLGLKILGDQSLSDGLGLELNVNFPLETGEPASFTPWVLSTNGQSSAASRFRHPAQHGALSLSIQSWLAGLTGDQARTDYKSSELVFSQSSLDFATPLHEGHHFIDVSEHVMASKKANTSPLYFDMETDELIGSEGAFLHIVSRAISKYVEPTV